MTFLSKVKILFFPLFAGLLAAASMQQSAPLPPPYDKAIFQKPIPNDELSFLSALAGRPAKDVVRDKQFRKLLRAVLPDCMFHYGSDMPPTEAFDLVLKGSLIPSEIRDGRYFMVAGASGPYLRGRGFVWIDMQEGIGLAGFYFHPTNGEPTPTVTILSKQVKEESLSMSQMPPAFADDLGTWSAKSSIGRITTRYFITGDKKKILLEHDEDFCVAPPNAVPPPFDLCQQMNADAAEIDMNAAYYLDQTNHATNATAWMIMGQDQIAWIQVRESTCRVGPDPLRCRIRMTRERTRVFLRPRPMPRAGGNSGR